MIYNTHTFYWDHADCLAKGVLEQANYPSDPGIPVPDWHAIDLYIKTTNLPIIWTVVFDNERIVAVAPLVCERRRLHLLNATVVGIAGYDFFDYNALYCENGYWPVLRSALLELGKRHHADLVHLDNLLITRELYGADVRQISRTVIFDAKESTTGWNGLRLKKSLVRHHRTAARELDYSCSHYRGAFNREHWDEIADLHVERWRFDGVESPLAHESRRNLYYAFGERALVTVIRNGTEIVAAHYGLVFGKTVIWHTPVVNIKYLEHSPMELLLYELAQFCELNGFQILDFGLGDETYKARFANNGRDVSELVLPISIYGAGLSAIHRLASDRRKARLRAWLGVARKTVQFLKARFRTLLFYTAGAPACPTDAPPAGKFVTISDYLLFVGLCRTGGLAVQRFHYERFKRGERFICVTIDGRIASNGWVRTGGSMTIGETGQLLEIGDCDVLYDFSTVEDLRGKGLYTSLLRSWLRLNRERNSLIYVLKNNVASVRAIERSGFRPIGSRDLRSAGILR